MKEFCPAQFYFKKRFKGLFIVESALSLSSWFTGTPLKYWLTNKCFKHNVTGLKTSTGRRVPDGYLQAWPRI